MSSSAASAPLIGRDADLAVLAAAVIDARSGHTRTVVLGGEAGIGKTRLIAEFIRGLPPGAIAALGQCVDLDRDAPPYTPIVGALRSLAGSIGTGTLLDAAGPARGALELLLPELAADTDATVTAAGSPTAGSRGGAERMYDGVAVALENVAAEHPLVIVIEDIQWADQASLGLLRFLVRVVESARILFVLSYRSDDLRRANPLRAWLPELDRGERVHRHVLARLSRAEVSEQVAALLGTVPTARDTEIVFARTDGVPFLVEELVSFDGYENTECFPDSLRDILLARYVTLGDGAQRFLRLAAAAGTCVDHSLLESVFTGTADELDGAAREAVLAGVLEIDETTYAFRHSLVREAIHEELLPGERVCFHTAYARALEAGGPSSEVSYHWMAAHDTRNAFIASLTAMAAAHGSFAFATAAQMGERALELWDQIADAPGLAARTRASLLADVAHDLRNAGESERAIALVDEAIAESGTSAPPEERARLLREKASYLANVGRAGSVDLLEEALGVLDGSPSSVLRAIVLGELAARLMLDARFGDAIATADLAFAEAQEVDSPARMSVSANIRGMSLLAVGQIDRGLADLELAGRTAGGNDSARLRYWVNMSDAMNVLGRFDAAVRIAEEGARGARLRGVERTSGAMLMSNTIEPLYALGEWGRADDLLDRALALDPPIGYSAHLKRLKLWSTLWRGDVAGAVRLLRGWRAPLSVQLQIDAQSRIGLARVAGEIALEDGRPADAWAEVSESLEPDRHGIPAYDLPLLTVAARALAALRAGHLMGTVDADRIEEHLRAVLERARFWPTAPPYIALFEAELGGPERSGTDVALWRAAADALAAGGGTLPAGTAVATATATVTATAEGAAGSGTPAHLRGYALIRLAEALAQAGDRAAARTAAIGARSEALGIGAGLIVARADDLERRAGLGGHAPGRTPDPLPLTERERQVLALVAEGNSNRQIAEHLFISSKTASVHVSSILRKLGAATRTEAVFLARQLH